MERKKSIFKRITSYFMVTVMLVITLFSNNAITVSADNGGLVTIRFHYTRTDQNYSDWNVWGWSNESNGAWYSFDQRDGNGNGVAVIENVAISDAKFGYLIATKNWTKDYDSDRFVELTNVTKSIIDVYITSGNANVSTEYSDNTNAIKSGYISGKDEMTLNTSVKISQQELNVYDVTASKDVTSQIKAVSASDDSAKIIFNDGMLPKADEYRVSYGNGGYTINVKLSYESSYFKDNFTYSGDDLGATYSKASTTFKVWAPTADSMTVYTFDSATSTNETPGVYKMTGGNAADKGVWTVTVPGDLKNKYYVYGAVISGKTNYCMDPYAKSGVTVTDTYNVAAGSYSAGQRSMVTDLNATNPTGWDNDSHVITMNKTDASVYELSVRDFSSDPECGISQANRMKFLAFTEKGTTLTTDKTVSTGIDYIKKLGVSYIQIMPMYDYAGTNEFTMDGYNWGYNPVNYNFPEGSFSTNPNDGNVKVNECKQMVQSIHNEGMGVIMDVVYNHVNDDRTYCFNQLVPGYFTRGSNGSGCGNDVASERPMVRKYIVDSVKYWANEYHIDGFRFDLVGLLDVDTMNALRAELNKINPSILVYGEGWSLSTSPVESVGLATQGNTYQMPGVGMFNDVIRSAIRGGNDSTSTGFAMGNLSSKADLVKCLKGQNWFSNDPTQIINYISCHDNYTLWDKIVATTNGAWDSTRTNMNKLAAALNISAQGVPLFQAGEEFLRTKGGDENSYNAPDSVNMMDWSLAKDNKAVVDYYAGLLKFRNAHTALRMTSAEDISNATTDLASNENIIAYTIDGKAAGDVSDKILVAFNTNLNNKQLTLPSGEWKVCVNGSKAGTDVIETVSGTLDMTEYSAYILVQGNTQAVTTPLTSSMISLNNSSLTYTGSEIKPSVTVTANGKTLTVNQDYTVSYSNNVNAGTAVVTVSGKGNYTGSATKSFTISKRKLSVNSISVAAKKYDGTNKCNVVMATLKCDSSDVIPADFSDMTFGTDFTVTAVYDGTAVGTDTVSGTVLIISDTFKKNYEMNSASFSAIRVSNAIISADTKSYNVVLSAMSDGISDTAVNMEGQGTYNENSVISVRTQIKEKYKFLGWFTADNSQKGYSGSALCNKLNYTFTVKNSVNLVAVYEKYASVTLSVTGTNYSINGESINVSSEVKKNYTYGTIISLSAKGSGFVHWVNATGDVLSESATYTFAIVSNKVCIPVYDNVVAGKSTVEFTSSYGQVIKSIQVSSVDDTVFPEGPAQMGYTFTGWNMTAQQINAAIADGNTFIQVLPIYEKNKEKYSVTVGYSGTIRQADVYADNEAGSTMTLTAPVIDGKEFSHWSSDAAGKNVLGTSNSYYIAITSNVSVYAVYVNEGQSIDKRPVITISDVYATKTGNSNMLSFSATRDIPEGFTLLEQGIIYGVDAKFANDTTENNMYIGAVGVGVYSAVSVSEAGVFTLNVNVENDTNTIVYVKGYVTVRDESTGNIETYYSTSIGASFNNIY